MIHLVAVRLERARDVPHGGFLCRWYRQSGDGVYVGDFGHYLGTKLIRMRQLLKPALGDTL